jgi:hypothetical protein
MGFEAAKVIDNVPGQAGAASGDRGDRRTNDRAQHARGYS